MPRFLRIEFFGAFHHVMARGNRREAIWTGGIFYCSHKRHRIHKAEVDISNWDDCFLCFLWPQGRPAREILVTSGLYSLRSQSVWMNA